MEKYLIGSSLLGIKNTRDKDYIVFIDNANYTRSAVVMENLEGNIHYRNKDDFIKSLNFKLEDYKSLVNYQCDREFIGEDFPIEYHILDYKDKVIEMLKRISKFNKCGFSKNFMQGDNCCIKRIYHIAYNIFIVQNNSVELTDKQLEIVQKIHDIQMPIDYIDTLKEMIDNL